MTLLWLFAQLVFWVAAFLVTLALFAVAVLAPPVLAARWLWQRLTA